MVEVNFFSFVISLIIQTWLVVWGLILKLVESKEVFVFLLLFFVIVVILTKVMESRGVALIVSAITALLGTMFVPDLSNIIYLPFESVQLTIFYATIIILISLFFSTPYYVRKPVLASFALFSWLNALINASFIPWLQIITKINFLIRNPFFWIGIIFFILWYFDTRIHLFLRRLRARSRLRKWKLIRKIRIAATTAGLIVRGTPRKEARRMAREIEVRERSREEDTEPDYLNLFNR